MKNLKIWQRNVFVFLLSGIGFTCFYIMFSKIVDLKYKLFPNAIGLGIFFGLFNVFKDRIMLQYFHKRKSVQGSKIPIMIVLLGLILTLLSVPLYLQEKGYAQILFFVGLLVLVIGGLSVFRQEKRL